MYIKLEYHNIINHTLLIIIGLGNRGVSNAHEASLGYGGDIDDLSTSLFGFAASGRKKPNYFLTDHTDDAGYSPLPRLL